MSDNNHVAEKNMSPIQYGGDESSLENQDDFRRDTLDNIAGGVGLIAAFYFALASGTLNDSFPGSFWVAGIFFFLSFRLLWSKNIGNVKPNQQRQMQNTSTGLTIFIGALVLLALLWSKLS
jgi:hypothetical protein